MTLDLRPPEGIGCGLIPRDYSLEPVGYFASAFDLPLIPRSEWSDRIAEKDRAKSWLSDQRARQNIKSTNQGQTNYCWAHSSASAVMLTRAQQGEPHVQLSATSIACKIKNFANQGGWGSQSLEYTTEHGICTIADWPEGPTGRRQEFDTPMAWATAKRFRVVEWMDLQPGDVDQFVTCLLLNIPVVSDYNWWRHSVCSMRVKWDGRNVRTVQSRIWNSWGDGWGENGEGWLDPAKSIPNGAIAPRVVVGS